MASARLLSKNIILSRKLNSISEGAENLYYRLLVMSDDFGCYHADPAIIKGTAYTLKNISLSSIEKRLIELDEINLINMYKVNGESYIQIKKFEEYQRFRSDIKRKSEYPTFEQRSRNESVRNRTDSNVESSSVSNNRNRSNNNNENKNAFETEFESLWKKYHIDGRKNKEYSKKRFIALCKAGKLDEFKKGYSGYATYLEYKEKKENFKQAVKYFSTLCTDYPEYIQYYGHKVEASL